MEAPPLVVDPAFRQVLDPGSHRDQAPGSIQGVIDDAAELAVMLALVAEEHSLTGVPTHGIVNIAGELPIL